MKFFLDCRNLSIEEVINFLKSNDLELSGILLSQSESQPLKKLESKGIQILISENDFLIDLKGNKIGYFLSIGTPNDMAKAMDLQVNRNDKFLLIETKDWHIIPIENLIAKYRDSIIELIVSASTPEEITLVKDILELGVEGCLLKPNNEYQIKELINSAVNKFYHINLIEFPIVSVKKIGSGERVCVDTCSLLKHGEGLLVGATSALFILVQAEVEETGFVEPRPFRINAGVIASYILNKDKTAYLSELHAGSKVMIVSREGKTRFETVARVKIERRPLILIKVEYENKEFPIILQDAETVRLVNSSDSIRINSLKPGDKVLGTQFDIGRHFGMEINEFLEEH
ncbi:MAG: 3-dehydroquinate synthase II [Promethearchaeota archaeon]